MKANELRVGNWVMGDLGKPYRFELSDFSDWYNDHNSHEFGDHIYPIPLSEEWLLKFGFDKLGKFERNVIGFETIYKIKDSSGGLSCVCLYESDSISYWYFKYGFADLFFKDRFKYIHQLQNLYCALTGDELKIKES